MPQLLADSKAIGPDMDLSEYYVIVGDPTHLYSVTYNKKSQSNMRPQTQDANGLRWYLIPKSEEPTTLVVQPGVSTATGVRYGIKSISDENGDVYSSKPRVSSTSMTNMKPGVPVYIESCEMEKILTGRLIVNVQDDPSRVAVFHNAGAYTVSYLPKDFTGNTLEIKYDPATETNWVIYRANGDKLFLTKLDGVKQERTYVPTPVVNGTIKVVEDFQVILNRKKTEYKVDVLANPIELNVPMKFECVQTTGNETDPERLSDMIEAVTISGGPKYTNKEWTKDGFTVPNGKSVSVTIKTQSYGRWELEDAYFNGHKLSSSGSSMPIEVESASEVQTYRLRGKMNNPWRYTLKLGNPTRTQVRWAGSELNIPAGATTYEGTGGLTAPVLKPKGINSDTDENPVIVT